MATRRLYKVTRENKKDEKFAPQAQAILDTIRSSEQPIERGALFVSLEKSGALKTKQDTARVFAFFRPRLLEAGVMKEIKETVESEKPVKAAKTEKTAKPAPKKAARVKKTAPKAE